MPTGYWGVGRGSCLWEKVFACGWPFRYHNNR